MCGEKERKDMECTKCGGKMAEGTKAIFGEVFGCTRRDPEKLEELNLDRVQPYYCTECGYVEFFMEKRKG